MPRSSRPKISRAEMEKNLAAKIDDPVFLRDVPPLLVADSKFDAADALDLVMRELVSLMPAGAAQRPRRPR